MTLPIPILVYEKPNQKAPFNEWLESFKDLKIQTRIWSRVRRMAWGNAGDYRQVGKSVYEMRLHFGSGYRVYYAWNGREIVLLLLGGDKSTQLDDIRTAQIYWQDYLRRKP